MNQHVHHADTTADHSLTDQDIKLILDSLTDNHDLNPARAALLGAQGRDPTYWTTLYRAFTGFAADGLEVEGPGEWLCLDCALKDFVRRGLLTRRNADHLIHAQTRVARRAAHFVEVPYEGAMLAQDSRPLAAAGYALARDLSQLTRHPDLFLDEG